MKYFNWFCSLLLALCCVSALSAAPLRQAHVQAELVSASQALVPGRTQWLALHLKIDPQWHVYWRNPGSAGYSPELVWTLPPGCKVGPILWPLPEKKKILELPAYVYEGEVYLPISLDVPKEGLPSKVTLKAHVRWLSCRESCVPGEGDLEITLPVAEQTGPSSWQRAIEDARNRLPLAQGLTDLALSRDGEGGASLQFSVVTEGAVEKAVFYPYDQGLLDEDAPQPFQIQGTGGTLQLKVAEGKAISTSLTGLLLVTQGGKDLPFDVNATLGAAKTAAAVPPPAPPLTSWGSFWESLLLAFIGGMILNLMPCVFPVLSLKVLSLVQRRDPEHKPQIHGLAFTAGVLVSFWVVSGVLLALRASGQKLGWGFQMQSPVFVSLMACLFFLIGLNLFGLFEVGEGLTRYGAYADSKTGYSESFWSGALATLVATPCSAPLMGAALGYALTQPPVVSLMIFTSLGLGMALPYVLLTSFPRLLRFLPRPGVWMETFKQLMAFPMLLTTVWFTYVVGSSVGREGMAILLTALVFLGMAAWMLGRWGWDPASQSLRRRARFASLALACLTLGLLIHGLGQLGASAGIAWQAYSQEKVEEARRQGHPVFVDFTADWCLSCKFNEKVALRNATVEARFRQLGMVAFKADWTARDAAISDILASFGRSGVPLYVYYPKGKDADVLPELITPQVVMEHLGRD